MKMIGNRWENLQPFLFLNFTNMGTKPWIVVNGTKVRYWGRGNKQIQMETKKIS
jgi:hypothetical protein